jgi:very-short-patch-repair endonuclease
VEWAAPGPRWWPSPFILQADLKGRTVGDLDRQLASIAAKNHSLITLDDVIAAGGSRAHAQRRVKAGRWESAALGVYRVAGIPWTYEATVMSAVLAAGPGAVASHLCAARLLGLGFRTAQPELSVPRGRNYRSSGFRVHESTDLDRCSVRVVSGIPITDPNRTLLDLGRYIGPRALRRAAEDARRLELVTWRSLLHTLLAHARQGRHGVRRLREVVSRGMVLDGVTDTDSELIAWTLLREHGLAEPVLHHQIRDADGELLAEIDLAWVERKAALEIDGTVHMNPEVRAKDEARDHFLRSIGWTVRRVWYLTPLEQPDRFLQIARALYAETA